MKWTIDPEVRDQFSMGVHRDILIVPHATKVEPVKGKPPKISNKRPLFEYVKNSEYPDGTWIPKYENGQLVYDDVDWVIDNSILVKEQFKYSYSLNSDDNLTFSGANAAMVQFTIRNNKEYVEEIDYETKEGTGNYYWEQQIPNLQYYQFIRKAPDGTERVIEGELSGSYIIKVYTYINSDSSTLMCLGMFAVEEDKITGNGYERQITAYDFMTTFRDMDIFYWYKHLFTGINISQDDYLDFTGEAKKKEDTDDPDAETNWIRKPADDLFPPGEHWTIGAALKDLMENLAAYDMIVWEDELDSKGKPTGKKIAKNGMTINNPSEYKRDYDEGTAYSGYGMPIVLDPDLFEVDGVKKEASIPTEWGEEAYECYGYMDIMDMPFMENPDIMKKESLSMGKLLEDIGRLAGRYPYIRSDKFDEHDYVDPSTVQPTEADPHPNKYNNYERCILTFKPLPSDKDDDKIKNIPDMILTNHEIVKGFEHSNYKVDDIEIVKIGIKDEEDVTYKRLNKTQRNQVKKGAPVQTFSFSDNMFASYLVTKSDKDEIKANLEEYAKLRVKLFGNQTRHGNMSSKALFCQGYLNMRHRGYTPFQLTTYGDPCRDVGDRIQVIYEDKLTGEKGSFYTYILERTLQGIQKMMDTYQANGDIYNPIFSNYQTGSKYQSGSTFSQQVSGYNAIGTSGELNILGITPNDLVEYWRNFGIRLLAEPTKCSAKFMQSSESTGGGEKYSYTQVEAQPAGFEDPWYVNVEHNYLINNPNQNPIHIYISTWPVITGQERIDCGMYEAKNFDMVYEYEYDDPLTTADSDTIFIFYNGTWYPAYTNDEEDMPSYINVIANISQNGSDRIKEGPTGQLWVTNEYDEIEQKFVENTYASTYDVLTINGNTTQVNYSNNINVSGSYVATFIPPGIWSNVNNTSGGSFTETTLANVICYHYLGEWNDSNVYDGSTTTTISVLVDNVATTITVQEYDFVAKNNDEDIFIFYDGSWKDVSSRQRQIADIQSEAQIRAIPEIAEIMLKGNPPQYEMRNYSRLYGYDLNTLTINGQTVNVEVFDTLKISQYYYLTYTPNKVWYPLYLGEGSMSTSDDSIYVTIRSDTIIKERYVALKWKDPDDITDWEPTPCAWEGTVIVRKENGPPLHRWDGTKVVRTTTKNKYKSKAYKDEDIEANKVYYYGFFPYYTKISDPNHPIRWYTFTKYIRVETGVITYAPIIDNISVEGLDATIEYTIITPAGSMYTKIMLYGKKGDNPTCDDTDDIVIELDENETSEVIQDLDEDSIYYFCIVATDINNVNTSSAVESIEIGEAPGPQPDPQYVEYINLINGNNNLYKYYMTDNWMQLYDGTTRGFYYFNDEGKKYTYVISNGRRRSIMHWNNATYSNSYITYLSGNYYSTYNCYALDIIDININGDNDSYTITTSLLNPNPNFINNRFGGNVPCYAGKIEYYHNNNTWNFGVSTDTTSKPTVEDITYTGTLENCFKYLAMNVRNANIYVNGVLWALSANNN